MSYNNNYLVVFFFSYIIYYNIKYTLHKTVIHCVCGNIILYTMLLIKIIMIKTCTQYIGIYITINWTTLQFFIDFQIILEIHIIYYT